MQEALAPAVEPLANGTSAFAPAELGGTRVQFWLVTMHFDLTDMKLFVHIAESESLTHAAQRSHMSLPAASMRIKNVEKQLGAKLLCRSSRGVKITPAGKAFLRCSRITTQGIEHLLAEMQEYANGVKGRVRIFANTNSIEFLPAVLSAFLASHPDVGIDLKECLSTDAVRAVIDGTADIGVAAGNVHTGDLQMLPYKRDRLVLVTSHQHPLAGRKGLSFEETLEFDYVGLLEGSAIHAYLSQAARDLDKTLKVRIQVGNFEALCRMIALTIGIGVVPESVARRHKKSMDICLIPLQDDWAVRNLQICIRSLELLPSFAKELIDLLVEDASAPCECSPVRTKDSD
jgi:DNA-binding transcriptional LysR family regulator